MNAAVRLEHDSPRPGRALTVRALLTLSGTPPSGRERVPLNLSLVLDRSGSMHGDKMEAAREAAALAVRRLWPEDVVSVVAYDDRVEVVAEPDTGSGQAGLDHRLRAIDPRGTTNLSGGWLKGRELVERNLRNEGANRILLLTDGLANQGITDPQRLMGLCRAAAAGGVATTTIGFGRDFDETLLRSMADAGGGGTYYIEEPDQAPAVFEEELEGLLSLCAQNVTARIRTSPAVRLALVRHSYPSTGDAEGVLLLEMGDLYAREPKRLLVELVLDPVPEAGDTGLAVVSLAADVVEEGGRVVRREIELPFTLDVEGGARVDPEVRREALLLDAADAREKAMERQREGDYGAAAEYLAETARSLKEAGIDDERLTDEREDMERLAREVASAPMSPADMKYMAQRSYDTRRSRSKSWKTISRRESTAGRREKGASTGEGEEGERER